MICVYIEWLHPLRARRGCKRVGTDAAARAESDKRRTQVGVPSGVAKTHCGKKMKYMVVETFAPGRKAPVYERFQQKGRMLPDGLYYIDSWLEKDGDRCFQLMETGSPQLFETWISNWKDLVSFEVIELESQ